MVNAQQWLDKEYPNKEERVKVEELDIGLDHWKNLKGKLNLNDFVNLKRFDCSYNKLTSLNLTNCEKLEELDCYGNKLTKLILPNNGSNVAWLDIRDNNFSNSDLVIFAPLVNLERLRIGNWNKDKIEQKLYNRFHGSLEPLKNLTKLKSFDISNTDINSGWEYLPASLEAISFSNEERPNSKVKEIAEQLKWIKKGFSGQQLKAWIDFGFQPENYGLAYYLTKKGYNPRSNLNLEELKAEYYGKSQNSQEWLDKTYPKEKRSKAYSIYLNEPSLEGELDLGDFTYNPHGIGVKIYISSQVDETKLIFKNLLKEAEIILQNPQKYLQQKYPTKKDRERETEIDIREGKNLEGDLNLSDFINLKELWCYGNKLTNITLPINPTNLKILDLRNNNFPAQDLAFLVPYTNLEGLYLGNAYDQEKINQGIYNKFTGSLNYLSEMKQLKRLDINYTDINEVNIDKLPRSLEKIRCDMWWRPDCKLTEIVPQLKIFNYGRCHKCQQFNTSEKWCQPCSDKEWTQDLEQLTGQDLVEKFIQQQPGRYKNLKWIPYEQFTNIEHLAEGGFSKIYKAKWGTEKDWRGNDKIVALKSFHNSQKVTSEFLSEVANTKLVDDYVQIINCYGISQDSVTKNYVMVMDYKKEGSLRQFLQNKTDRLSFEDKLGCLQSITDGLKDIHDQNLVHRDFHSGNILNDYDYNDVKSYITDLGLSRPVNSQKEAGKIFGVLPYVAPEVLLEKPYTNASDVYSFGIIVYELLTNSYPYAELDGLDLALSVCQGLRPKIDNLKIPQLLKDLIKKCWDADSKQRPNADELKRTIGRWNYEIRHKENNPFYQQYQALEQEYNIFSQNTPYKIHPTAIMTSKMIDTKQITKRLKTMEYSQSLEPIDFTKLNLKDKKESNNSQDNSNWTNIHPNFTKELINQWQSNNSTPQQTQDWLKIGLKPTDANFCTWLRDTKRLTPEQVLNHYNLEQLNQEFFNWWQEQQQTQIEQLPK